MENFKIIVKKYNYREYTKVRYCIFVRIKTVKKKIENNNRLKI